ncbi:Thiol-disulfide isomerase or thioredoxin [bacterium A37T11]|nr:Thiol-disulfide isomerase or thioredoxin [bacterium A37T11]
MKNRITKFLLIIALIFVAISAKSQKQQKILKIGDPAPKITTSGWIKGNPVNKFEKGHVYVVEFWATWCGPCKMAMPHLSKLARKYSGKATIIGFDVLENRYSTNKKADYLVKVKQFVDYLGDGIDYTVAADVANDLTWNDWMTAAGLKGIPTSFVINQNGCIAWIGHPFAGLEYVLDRVITGKFDKQDKKDVDTLIKKQNDHLSLLRIQYMEYIKNGNDSAAFNVAQECVENSLLGKGIFMTACFDLLEKNDQKKAHQYAQQIMERYADDPISLAMFGKTVVEKDNTEDKRLGLRIMEQAFSRLSPIDSYSYSEMAAAYFQVGDLKNAIKLQQKVIDIINDPSLSQQNEGVKIKAEENLAKYNETMK